MLGANSMGKIGSERKNTRENRGRGRRRRRGKPRKTYKRLTSTKSAIGLEAGLPYIYRVRKCNGLRGGEKCMGLDRVKLQPRVFCRLDERQVFRI